MSRESCGVGIQGAEGTDFGAGTLNPKAKIHKLIKQHLFWVWGRIGFLDSGK